MSDDSRWAERVFIKLRNKNTSQTKTNFGVKIQQQNFFKVKCPSLVVRESHY